MEDIVTLIVKWVFYILVVVFAYVLYKIARYVLVIYRQVESDHKKASENYKYKDL